MAKVSRRPNRVSEQDDLEAKWYQKLSWFTITASILLFGSWVSQNYLKTFWTDEKARLLRSQLVIDIEEGRMDLWDITYLQEIAKEKPDQDLFIASALKVIETKMQLSAWMEGRLASDAVGYNEILGNRDQLIARSQEMHKNKDYKGLLQLAQKVSEGTDAFVPSQTQRFFIKVDEVESKERLANNLFLIPYVFGSLLLGVGFIKKELTMSKAVQ